MKKNIVSAAIGFGMVLAAVVPAVAVDCTNNTTGPFSSNICEIWAKRYAKVKLRNYGNVTNNVNTNTTTGDNQSNFNTDSGLFGIVTGNGVADVNPVTSQVNTNTVTVNQSAPCDNCTAATGSNYLTGPYSTNNVQIDVSKTAKVYIYNEGYVRNNVNTNVNTGNNTANYNTIGGSILTGDATANVGVNTVLNWNQVNISQ